MELARARTDVALDSPVVQPVPVLRWDDVAAHDPITVAAGTNSLYAHLAPSSSPAVEPSAVTARIQVYLELGTRRVFAGAIDWPGWCRSGRDEAAALETLFAYARRYETAVAPAGAAGRRFRLPSATTELSVVERLKGNATTDFGAPGIAPAADERAVSPAELRRLQELLRSCWAALDRSAEAASGAVLRTGPRGGGRKLEAIVAHVAEADRAYLSELGGRHRLSDAGAGTDGEALRRVFLETLASRARGEQPPPSSRRTKPYWSPRYAVRRSAWHALDHAWEIEDRVMPSP